jgi:hypothetical protein
MQPFLLLLLLAYSVTPTFTSAVSPNIVDRGDTRTSYTVMPADSANTASIETQLHMAYGDTNAVTHQKTETLRKRTTPIYNALAVHGSDVNSPETSKREIEPSASDQAQHDETTDTAPDKNSATLGNASLSDDQPPPDLGHADLVRRDTPVFRCAAKPGTNITKTEEFLKTQIKPGSNYYYFTRDGEIIGWWYLALDDAAQKAVENYEDIRFFEKGGIKLQDFWVLPTHDQLSDATYDSPGKATLSRRSGSWIKQQGADRALVMNSQYRQVEHTGPNMCRTNCRACSGASPSDLKDFVYKPDSGQGTFIYVIDQGVRVAAFNVSLRSLSKILQADIRCRRTMS